MRGLTAAEWGERLAPSLRIFRPAGPGPFPVVFQLHGCGGLQPLQARYAQAAAEAGVAAVVVDSFKPRRMSRLDGHLFVCTGARLRAGQRAADVHGLVAWLDRQDWADPARIAAAGWSHGGWTIMDALAHRAGAARATGLANAEASTLERLRGVFLVYPYAGYPSLTLQRGWGEKRPQTFAVLGGRDRVVGVRAPQQTLERLRADGVPGETLLLPEATHSFDDDEASDPRTRYRRDLEEQARAFYVASLQQMFAFQTA